MPQKPITTNTLFYGDNLEILREHIASECMDLVYLDPPFNSQANYNVLFRNEKGAASEAQIQAFTDTWEWSAETEATYNELVLRGDELGRTIEALRNITGKTSPMTAYLVTMAIRLAELRRILKPTGSLYLHCDPTASHYLKIILDTIFGPIQFKSEIIWKRYGAHNDANGYGAVHDVILYYTKSSQFTFNKQFQPYDEAYIAERFRFQDPDGRRWSEQNLASPNPRPNLTYPFTASNGITYQPPPNGWKYTRERMQVLDQQKRLHFPKREDGRLRLKNYMDEMPGVPVQDVWTDIPLIGGTSPERLGYPTQKPLALLERIVQTSSNPGDVVFDPFAGCGTTIAAAQKLGRTWGGIDVTHLAIAAVRGRMEKMFLGITYKVIGEPEDMDGARALANSLPDGRYQFQWWALSGIKAMPLGGQGGKEGKKGADQGIDGQITFIDDATGKAKRVIVQVKSGKVSSQTIRDLVGTVEREKAAIGVLLTLEEPSTPMIKEAVVAGVYHSPGWNRNYPKIQIISIAEMLKGKRVEMPLLAQITFKQAQKVQQSEADQSTLFDM